MADLNLSAYVTYDDTRPDLLWTTRMDWRILPQVWGEGCVQEEGGE